MFAKRSLSPLAPWLLMAVLPVCVHLPALTGWLHFDPLLAVSGVTEGTWTTNGLIAGRPGWVDANAGVTTEALGALAARDWLHGIVPWWNPFSGVGMPLAAEGQTTAFFLPFGLLLALPHGLLALRILLMMLAGVFTLALLRRLGLARMPATVGAALFQVNGVFAWMAHGPMMPVAFLPLLLLGLENAAQGLRDHETIGGGYDFPWAIVFGTFWSLTAGFPETAGIDGLLAASWAMLRLVQSRHPAHYAARVFFAALIGALLASPALWAFFQALPTDFLGDHAAPIAWAFLPANWSLLLFPYLFGNIHYATAMLGQAGGIWARAGGYCDIVLVTLAVLGLRRAGPHAALRWLLLGWVLVFLARAAAIPGIGQMLDAVPLLGRSMLHVYVLPSWCMALSLLAAFGVNDWQRGAPAPIGPGLCFAALATAAALAAGWSTLGPLWQAIPSYRPYPILDLAEAGLVLVAITTLWRKPPAGWRRALLGTVIVGQAAALCAFPLLAGTRGRAIDAGSNRYLQDHRPAGAELRRVFRHCGARLQRAARAAKLGGLRARAFPGRCQRGAAARRRCAPARARGHLAAGLPAGGRGLCAHLAGRGPVRPGRFPAEPGVPRQGHGYLGAAAPGALCRSAAMPAGCDFPHPSARGLPGGRHARAA
jgi:hypothetical protein